MDEWDESHPSSQIIKQYLDRPPGHLSVRWIERDTLIEETLDDALDELMETLDITRGRAVRLIRWVYDENLGNILFDGEQWDIFITEIIEAKKQEEEEIKLISSSNISIEAATTTKTESPKPAVASKINIASSSIKHEKILPLAEMTKHTTSATTSIFASTETVITSIEWGINTIKTQLFEFKENYNKVQLENDTLQKEYDKRKQLNEVNTKTLQEMIKKMQLKLHNNNNNKFTMNNNIMITSFDGNIIDEDIPIDLSMDILFKIKLQSIESDINLIKNQLLTDKNDYDEAKQQYDKQKLLIIKVENEYKIIIKLEESSKLCYVSKGEPSSAQNIDSNNNLIKGASTSTTTATISPTSKSTTDSTASDKIIDNNNMIKSASEQLLRRISTIILKYSDIMAGLDKKGGNGNEGDGTLIVPTPNPTKSKLTPISTNSTPNKIDKIGGIKKQGDGTQIVPTPNSTQSPQIKLDKIRGFSKKADGTSIVPTPNPMQLPQIKLNKNGGNGKKGDGTTIVPTPNPTVSPQINLDKTTPKPTEKSTSNIIPRSIKPVWNAGGPSITAATSTTKPVLNTGDPTITTPTIEPTTDPPLVRAVSNIKDSIGCCINIYDKKEMDENCCNIKDVLCMESAAVSSYADICSLRSNTPTVAPGAIAEYQMVLVLKKYNKIVICTSDPQGICIEGEGGTVNGDGIIGDKKIKIYNFKVVPDGGTISGGIGDGIIDGIIDEVKIGDDPGGGWYLDYRLISVVFGDEIFDIILKNGGSRSVGGGRVCGEKGGGGVRGEGSGGCIGSGEGIGSGGSGGTGRGRGGF